jgi:hypothetical protein
MVIKYLCMTLMFMGFVLWNAGPALGGIACVAQKQLLQSVFTLSIFAPM